MHFKILSLIVMHGFDVKRQKWVLLHHGIRLITFPTKMKWKYFAETVSSSTSNIRNFCFE